MADTPISEDESESESAIPTIPGVSFEVSFVVEPSSLEPPLSCAQAHNKAQSGVSTIIRIEGKIVRLRMFIGMKLIYQIISVLEVQL